MTVGVGVRVEVDVTLGVAVRVAVRVGVGVAVPATGVAVTTGVGVLSVAVGPVASTVGVAVFVRGGVTVRVGVGVREAVSVGVAVTVGHKKAVQLALQHEPSAAAPLSHVSPNCRIPSPQTGQLVNGPFTIGLSMRFGLKTTFAPMTGFTPGRWVVMFEPPGGATYCESCWSCIARRDTSSMSEPPGRLLTGFTPPVPSILTNGATVRPHPASVMLCPLP